MKEELKIYVYNNIYDKIKFIACKNAIIHLINPLIKLFCEGFHLLYGKEMTQNDFIQTAKNSIKVHFTKLEKEIKEYYEKKAKDTEKKEQKNKQTNKGTNIANGKEVAPKNSMENYINSLY